MTNKEKIEQLYKACNLIIEKQYELDKIEDIRARNKEMTDKMYVMNKVNIFNIGFKEMYHYLFKEYWRKLSIDEEMQLKQLRISLVNCGDYIKELIDIDAKQLEKILSGGQITSKKEYAIAEARVEEIYQDETKKEELVQLNNLLVEYLKKHRN